MSIARCLAEQRACLEYLKGDGPNKAGARQGLEDWLAEEVEIRLEQKLPTPYYEHAGITIYHGVHSVVKYTYGTTERLQTDPGAHREPHEVAAGREAPLVEGGRYHGARRKKQGATIVSAHWPVCVVWKSSLGATSHRRRHGKQ